MSRSREEGRSAAAQTTVVIPAFNRVATSPLRIFLPVSLVSFAVGAGCAAWTIATQSHVTNSSVLLVVLSVRIFLIGLVSEPIAALRFEGPRR